MGHSQSSPKEKLVSIKAYLKKQESFQIDNLILHLKKLEKEKKTKHKVSRKNKVIKITEEINLIGSKKQ